MNKLNIYGKLRIIFGEQQLIVMLCKRHGNWFVFTTKNSELNYYGYCGRIVEDEGLTGKFFVTASSINLNHRTIK